MQFSTGYGGRQAAQPNNTYINIDSVVASSHDRVIIFCCSNSTASYVGSFTDPYGLTSHTNSYKFFNYDIWITHYSRYSEYAGCIQLWGWNSPYYTMNYHSGVYICNIPDSRGNYHQLNFALYSENGMHNCIINLDCHNKIRIFFISH